MPHVRFCCECGVKRLYCWTLKSVNWPSHNFIFCSVFNLSNFNPPPHSGGHNQPKDVGRSPTWGCLTIWDFLLWEIFQSYCKPSFFVSLPPLSVKLLLLSKTSLLADTTAASQASWVNKGNRCSLFAAIVIWLLSKPTRPRPFINLLPMSLHPSLDSTSNPAETMKLIYCDLKMHYPCKYSTIFKL